MSRRNEICRNFARGSCQYGERCKFLHVKQQYPNSNRFSIQSGPQFNQQQQQQSPNPFGFGVQNNSHSKSAIEFGPKHQSQIKPFENKWTRFGSISAGNSTTSRRSDNQPQVVSHKCTDPESCKRQIAEDFQNERPLWRLTCYGHSKNGPCDIVGDISYEELRAAAYEDARQGRSLQYIVEKERNLLNSKLIEFDSLLRNPFVVSSSSNAGVLSNEPLTVSSFSQLASSIDSGLNARFPVPSNNAFGKPSPLQVPNQTSGGFRASSSSFMTSGIFQSQPSAPGANAPNSSTGVVNLGSNSFSFPPVASSYFPGSVNNQIRSILNGADVGDNGMGQPSMNDFSVDSKKVGNPEDKKIWLKEWKRGEIPEEPPPDEFIL